MNATLNSAARAPALSCKIEQTDLRGHFCYFAMEAGLRAIRAGKLKPGIKRVFYPVTYWRYPVFKEMLSRVTLQRGARILDIGSPKLLALYLAVQFPFEVHATDLRDETIDTMWRAYFEAFPATRRQGTMITAFEDAQRLSYPDESFDFVFSISVLEHIPADGDSAAMREIYRVLRPGGLAFIEIPYALNSYDTFRANDVYDRKFQNEPVFWERHYDDLTLKERLIEPSQLRLLSQKMLGERLPYEKFWDKTPNTLKAPFRWMESLASSVNHKSMVPDLLKKDREKHSQRAMDAMLLLRKQ